MSIFSERLTYLRRKNKKSHNEIAKHLNVTRGAYTHYECGRREPTFAILCQLASYFSVTPNFLLGFPDIPSENTDNLYNHNLSLEEQNLIIQLRMLPNHYFQIIETILKIALENHAHDSSVNTQKKE